jgi:cytochrome c551/c552
MKQVFGGKILGRVLLGVLVLLVAIQFVPVNRSNPPVESEVPAPASVRAVLRRACYDCHSNETVWPWYSHVAPVSWLVASDVRGGRKELNFSAWNRLPAQRQARKLKETWKEVSERDMPPWYYVPMHRDARLSAGDLETMRGWTLSAVSAPEAKVEK